MRPALLLLLAVLPLAVLPLARAYTVTIPPHNSQCYYLDVPSTGMRILFEFAVVTGGNFDIDYTVKDPKGGVVHSGQAETEGEFTFAVDNAGEYSFCFSNGMSTVSSKMVEFEIEIAGQGARGGLRKKGAGTYGDGTKEEVSPLQESIDALRTGITSIQHHVNTYKQREKVRSPAMAKLKGPSQATDHAPHQRNLDTSTSTYNRLFWNTIAQVLLVIVVAVGQVLLLRSFFATKKGRAI